EAPRWRGLLSLGTGLTWRYRPDVGQCRRSVGLLRANLAGHSQPQGHEALSCTARILAARRPLAAQGDLPLRPGRPVPAKSIGFWPTNVHPSRTCYHVLCSFRSNWLVGEEAPLSDPEPLPLTSRPLPKLRHDAVPETRGTGDPIPLTLSYHQQTKHHLDRYA